MMTSLYTIIQNPIWLRSNRNNNHWPNSSPKNHGIAFQSLCPFSFVLFCLTIIWHWSFFLSSAALSLIIRLSLSFSLCISRWWDISLHAFIHCIFSRSLTFHFISIRLRCAHDEFNGNQHNQRKFVTSNNISNKFCTRRLIELLCVIFLLDIFKYESNAYRSSIFKADSISSWQRSDHFQIVEMLKWLWFLNGLNSKSDHRASKATDFLCIFV